MDLAERLHRTLDELLDTMSSAELSLWMARDMLRAEEQAKQQRLNKMRQGRKGKR